MHAILRRVVVQGNGEAFAVVHASTAPTGLLSVCCYVCLLPRLCFACYSFALCKGVNGCGSCPMPVHSLWSPVYRSFAYVTLRRYQNHTARIFPSSCIDMCDTTHDSPPRTGGSCQSRQFRSKTWERRRLACIGAGRLPALPGNCWTLT